MHKLRTSKIGFTDFEKAVSGNDYVKAESQLKRLLGKPKQGSIEAQLLAEINSISKDPAQKKAFYDTLLAKTSGSKESRSLGKSIEDGKDVTNKVKKYLLE